MTFQNVDVCFSLSNTLASVKHKQVNTSALTGIVFMASACKRDNEPPPSVSRHSSTCEVHEGPSLTSYIWTKNSLGFPINCGQFRDSKSCRMVSSLSPGPWDSVARMLVSEPRLRRQQTNAEDPWRSWLWDSCLRTLWVSSKHSHVCRITVNPKPAKVFSTISVEDTVTERSNHIHYRQRHLRW